MKLRPFKHLTPALQRVRLIRDVRLLVMARRRHAGNVALFVIVAFAGLATAVWLTP